MFKQPSNDFSRELQPLLDFINHKELYKQSTGASPIYILFPFDGVAATFGSNISMVVTFRDGIFDNYINKQELITKAEWILAQEYSAKPVLQREYVQWCQQRNEHYQYIKTLSTKDLTAYSTEELLKELQTYNNIVFEMWKYSFVIDCFDPSGAEIVEREVWSHYTTLTPAKREILLKHTKLTTPELIEQRALQLLIEQGNDIAEQLHSEFHWVENNYAGIQHLSKEYFQKVLNELKAHYTSTAAMQHRIEELDGSKQQIESEKQHLFKAKHLQPPHQQLLNIFAFLTDWREERKRNTQLMAFGYNQFVNALSLLWELDVETVAQMHSTEYELFTISSHDRNTILERRKKTGLLYTINSSTGQRYLVDDPPSVEKVMREINAIFYTVPNNELRGFVAQKGKVEGVVKIVNHTSDFGIFNEGDILVSGMTRPELMPIIRKASGIITDEGGITCHAAVVSRELQIPCIVGTQIATRALKNRDTVILDANEGIVRKIS